MDGTATVTASHRLTAYRLQAGAEPSDFLNLFYSSGNSAKLLVKSGATLGGFVFAIE